METKKGGGEQKRGSGEKKGRMTVGEEERKQREAKGERSGASQGRNSKKCCQRRSTQRFKEMGENWLPRAVVNSSRARKMYNFITKESKAEAMKKIDKENMLEEERRKKYLEASEGESDDGRYGFMKGIDDDDLLDWGDDLEDDINEEEEAATTEKDRKGKEKITFHTISK